MNHLCGNKQAYNFIKEWIIKQLETTDKRLSYNNLLFVCGNSGIGKSYSVHKIASEILDLHVVSITSANCASTAELNDLMLKNTSSSMIQVLKNDTRKKIIIIDEFESMMAIDRTINTTLLNILTLQKLKMVPVICIISSDMMKKIGNIKKKCQIIELSEPSDDDILKLIQTLAVNRDIKYLSEVATTSAGNISQAIKKIHDKDESYQQIDKLLNINILYGKKFDRELNRRVVLTDPWIIPLKYHENLIDELQKRRICIAKSHEFYKEFLKTFVLFDQYMFHNSTDIATDIFVSSMYQLHNMQLKKNCISSIDNFTKLLSYMSLQKKNMKKQIEEGDFPLYQVGSYLRRNYMFLK
jgi:nucleoside-triphosphatase THEP1